jgi:hypothetical protein
MNINKLFDYSVPMVAAATIIGVSAILTVSIGAYTARDIKLAQDVIEVTGSAKISVVADTARWIINLETVTGVSDQQAGFDRLEEASEKVTAYLKNNGLTDYETPAMSSNMNYTYPQYGSPIFNGYTVSRQVIIRGQDIEKISNMANNMDNFAGTNYSVTTNSLELTYSKLDEVRVSLLTDAIQDATDRANAIAKESGRQVGMLKTASSGVVQVLPQDGVEVSDYGSYDTQSLNKDIMVTVRATFKL